MILTACAIVLAITGVGVATGAAWSRALSLVVGLAGLFVGFGGLLLIVGSSLIAAGMFRDVLLQPQNLTIALVMGVTGLTGIGLLIRRPTRRPPRLVRGWHAPGRSLPGLRLASQRHGPGVHSSTRSSPTDAASREMPISLRAGWAPVLAGIALAACEPVNTETVSLSSDAFADGGAIPSRFTCDGDDISRR